ncbi:MAG: hypothetical protein H7Y88_02555 [Phycisphaerales bacterium]|nr:hypothetical protein [Phycisphaerales bacterium]
MTRSALTHRRQAILELMLAEARSRRRRRRAAAHSVAAATVVLVIAGAAFTVWSATRPGLAPASRSSPTVAIDAPAHSTHSEPSPDAKLTAPAPTAAPVAASMTTTAPHPKPSQRTVVITRVSVNDAAPITSRVRIVRLSDTQLLDELAAAGRDQGLVRTRGTVALIDNRPAIVIDGRSL